MGACLPGAVLGRQAAGGAAAERSSALRASGAGTRAKPACGSAPRPAHLFHVKHPIARKENDP